MKVVFSGKNASNLSWQRLTVDNLTPHIISVFLPDHSDLGGGFKYFLFSPLFRKIPILTNIFQMG